MIEILVYMLMVTAGNNNGSSISTPIYFKDLIQCQHVAKEIYSMSLVTQTKCIQARIYIPATTSMEIKK